MTKLSVLLVCAIAGCGGPTFRNVGVGRNEAVPSESIDRYASEHGITKDEATIQLRAQIEASRIEDYAAKYGITEKEAKRQLEHAASTGNSD